MDLGNRATVSLVSDPFFLEGKRVFDGSDASIGIPSEDEPPRVRRCYGGVCPLISGHFSQDLWEQPPGSAAYITSVSRLCVVMKPVSLPHLAVLDLLQSRV